MCVCAWTKWSAFWNVCTCSVYNKIRPILACPSHSFSRILQMVFDIKILLNSVNAAASGRCTVQQSTPKMWITTNTLKHVGMKSKFTFVSATLQHLVFALLVSVWSAAVCRTNRQSKLSDDRMHARPTLTIPTYQRVPNYGNHLLWMLWTVLIVDILTFSFVFY